MDILSKRIRELRIDHDLKQGEMGAALGITQNMVSNYENGREPPYETVLAYARYFHVSVEYLLGVTNEPVRVEQDVDKAFEAMQAAADRCGDQPYTRGDIARLTDAFAAYYKAGAPAGSAPMACVAAFLPAMTRLLEAAVRQDAPAMLAACEDVGKAGLDVPGVLGSALGLNRDKEKQN